MGSRFMTRDGSRNILRKAFSPTFWFDHCWPVSRRYWFSLLFIAVICAKILHIYSHLNSLSPGELMIWGPTFFLQDVVCVSFAHILCADYQRRWARVIAALLVVPLSLTISGLSAANISFYVATGAEIHWKQAHNFHGDKAAVKTLLTGLTGLIIVEVVFVAASCFSTPHLYNWTKGIASIFKSVLPSACRRKQTSPILKSYERVAPEDWDEGRGAIELTSGSHETTQANAGESPRSPWLRVFVLAFTGLVIILRCIRPSNAAYSFLSDTVIVTPFDKNQSRAPSSVNLPELTGDYSWLGNHTALAAPPTFDWLPRDKLAGFSDWYENANHTARLHYDPRHDPIHISNLENEVLEPLRKALQSGSVNIKHVLLLKLESTRADVFPLRKESWFGDVIRESYNGQIPAEVEERLANLTPTAERLTATSSGFNGNDTVQPYGGFHATNAYTGDTFTLKSILATVCGIAPLVVDFNREYLYHIYQPCLPHILEALNAQANRTKTEDYTTWPWRSTWMQSITDDYDNQDLLTPALGFKHKVTDINISEDRAKQGGLQPVKYNFWGYPETELGDYYRNAIKSAEKRKERLFISHLTGITHHPWDTPNHKYEELISHGWLGKKNKVNRYLNTLGVADKWLAELLDILEETGVANETLVVMVGDHGISLPENSGVTPYDNPHISSFHVPLVFAHPQLPPIEIDSRVTSMQILPTILDILSESGSLDNQAKSAIQDLLPLYEGQSMIRPTIPEKDGKQDWQFSVMNTGGTWLALRSAAKPYRLVIPLIPDVEWRFSNVEIDPHELQALQDFNLLDLMNMVLPEHGEDAVQWINDAAHVAKWWVEENWRRYEYMP
ncbi:hypothetical protein DTO013E5_8 [Penicillium roqueforti]|uniref:Alkaline-phosphatase-like, core domain n=1 Tax=Penicillium roqueforti (strain FM164) TaxID=1365484 RepID=W6Q5U4_PENRF|nr:uncharacterized protein LCP9604111_1111 [Penicillium roqueforti]CDM31346.1 Alkaline-phosphatase-like, core domain [Penicillium roqueforti FM164]KAF9253585.1 hypothetical protein LCP9604111_1111 [Penicillium roqueforti]KAI2731362.1 hypothetical protein CBS147354_471 [Penicillium roqueforti]KAI2731917.1 hypothetical protein CBS147332_1056 [Penicillium roqueforti]KAI2746014.1 hypothetical protein DTO013F2_7186 [Penicillium roqueforti]